MLNRNLEKQVNEAYCRIHDFYGDEAPRKIRNTMMDIAIELLELIHQTGEEEAYASNAAFDLKLVYDFFDEIEYPKEK